MHVSNHNIIFKAPDEGFIIFNPLWGSMDILEPEEVDILEKIKTTGDCYGEEETLAALLEAGYVCMNESVENARFAAEYQKFFQRMASMPENFFIIPSYACNLACVYCFQKEMEKIFEIMDESTIDRVFATIDTMRNERGNKGRPQMSIYGGEPLLDNEKQIKAVKKILKESRNRGYKTLIITNGVTLKKLVPMLVESDVDEIHITLDGPRKVHDSRRMMRNGEGTFDSIVEGIEKALNKGLNIHLRMVVDRNNLKSVPDFVKFVDEKKWKDFPNFRMHIGRTYECGTVSSSEYKEKYYISMVELLQYYEEHVTELKDVDFTFRRLRETAHTGKAPSPLFSNCPSCTNEFVFDLKGDIYPCPGGCGDTRLRVGTFYPQVEYFDIFHKWRSRTILRMEKCQHCDVALVCGGGCPLENLAEGKDIFEPACIPVREEMQIGVNVLYPHLVQLADQPVIQEPCCGPHISVEESCCSQEEPGGDSVEKKKEQPRCNCGEVKIIPLDEEE